MTPIKWHGGKHYLAPWLLSMIPAHTTYCEPFAGGLSLLFAKSPYDVSEVIGDLDGELVNFYQVIKDPESFKAFALDVSLTPFSEQIWLASTSKAHVPAGRVDRAVQFFIRCRQSFAGRLESFAPLSTGRIRGGMNEQVSAWLSAIDGLDAVHQRLRRVYILWRPALDVIKTADSPRTFFYLDPPYLPSTRVSPQVYKHEMSEEDHISLLDQLKTIQGKFMLSGYDSDLYATYAAKNGWVRRSIQIANHSSSASTKPTKVEVVWMNYTIP